MQQSLTILTIAQVARLIGANLFGDGTAQVGGINTLEEAGADELAFISEVKYQAKAAGSKAAGIIVNHEIPGLPKPQPSPLRKYPRLPEKFQPPRRLNCDFRLTQTGKTARSRKG